MLSSWEGAGGSHGALVKTFSGRDTLNLILAAAHWRKEGDGEDSGAGECQGRFSAPPPVGLS